MKKILLFLSLSSGLSPCQGMVRITEESTVAFPTLIEKCILGAKIALGSYGLYWASSNFIQKAREYRMLKTDKSEGEAFGWESEEIDPVFIEFVREQLTLNGLNPDNILIKITDNVFYAATCILGNNPIILFDSKSYTMSLLALRQLNIKEAREILYQGFCPLTTLSAPPCCNALQVFKTLANASPTYEEILTSLYDLPNCCKQKLLTHNLNWVKGIIAHEASHIKNNDWLKPIKFSALCPLACLGLYTLLYTFKKSSLWQLPTAIALSYTFPILQAQYAKSHEWRADEAIPNDKEILEAQKRTYHNLTKQEGFGRKLLYYGGYGLFFDHIPSWQREARFEERIKDLEN